EDPLAQKSASGQQPASDSASADAKGAVQQSAVSGLGRVAADLDNDGTIDVLVANAVEGAAGPTAPQALSNYWIGIDGTPIDDALRSQLELPTTQGLLINQVVAESPAAKAGLKQYDVLISCQDAAIAQIADLAKLLDEKKETLLPLKLVRSGKRIIIEVTPQRRPASQTGDTCPAISKVGDEEFVRRAWLDIIGNSANDEEIQQFVSEKVEKKRELLVNRLMRKSTHADRSCTACHANDGDAQRTYYQSVINHYGRLRTNVLLSNDNHGLWQDVTVLPGLVQNLQSAVVVDVGQPLPDDVTVSITRKGKQPAKITVRKGDRIWEINESDAADKVPEEARTYLGPFCTSLQSPFFNRYSAPASTVNLQGQALQTLSGTLFWKTDAVGEAVLPVNAKPEPTATESAFQRLDKQLETLGSQLGELRQSMQQLHQTLEAEKAKPPAPEKKP
ncbi:MAG TPA: PDZ domain-containing protein, partial [Planctomycetaceae bacterium]